MALAVKSSLPVIANLATIFQCSTLQRGQRSRPEAINSTATRILALSRQFGLASVSTQWIGRILLRPRSCMHSCRAALRTIASSRPGTLLACARRALMTPFSRASLFPIATSREQCPQISPVPTFSSVYLGLAERAFDLAVEYAKTKKSVAMGGKSMAYNPMVQYAVAEMLLELEGIRPHVDRTTEDWSTGV